MGRPAHQLNVARCALLLLGAALGGCAVVPSSTGDGGATTTTAPESIGRPAGAPSAAASLLEQSRAARDAGDLPAAAIALERAVRIEPNDPGLWLEYGQVRLRQGDFDQADALARKAQSLAGGDRGITSAASRLIADATRERNRAAAGAAREAELR